MAFRSIGIQRALLPNIELRLCRGTKGRKTDGAGVGADIGVSVGVGVGVGAGVGVRVGAGVGVGARMRIGRLGLKGVDEGNEIMGRSVRMFPLDKIERKD